MASLVPMLSFQRLERGGRFCLFERTARSTAKVIVPTDCSLYKRERYSSAWYQKLGKKQPLAFWVKVTFLGKGGSRARLCACRLRPQELTASFYMSRKRR